MVFFKTPSILKNLNIERKLAVLAPVFTKEESVLDFGCGDLSLAKTLKSRNPSLTITGVDVVNVKDKPSEISFFTYNGSQLPFKDRTFDTTISFYVFHHCKDVEVSLRECVRVAKKRIIVVESVARSPIELPFMRFVDWLYNIWKPEPIPLTYQFLTLMQWQKLFKKAGLIVKTQKATTIMLQPPFLPIGRSYLFVLRRRQ